MEINKLLKDEMKELTEVEKEVLEYMYQTLDTYDVDSVSLKNKVLGKIDELMED